jgi:hypothetical protein
MPVKRVFSQSVGRAVFHFIRSLACAGLVAGTATLFTVGCTDNSGNGHFTQPQADGAAGAGGDMGTGGSGGGAGGAAGDNAGGSGGDGAGGAAGTGGDGTADGSATD